MLREAVMKSTQVTIDKESVWDYPKDGALEPIARRIRVEFNGATIADTTRAIRAVEKGLPPDYYIPPEDINQEYLVQTGRSTHCSVKGTAAYWSVKVADCVAENAVWAYVDTTRESDVIQGYFAFYPNDMDACLVDDMKATPRKSEYYAGWVTAHVEGPFVGDPGVDYDPREGS